MNMENPYRKIEAPEETGKLASERQLSDEDVIHNIAQEAILDAQNVIGENSTPESLNGVIQSAIKDFVELSEQYQKKAGELRNKLKDDFYKKKKQELVMQMNEEKNPDVLLFLSEEFMKIEDEGFGAKSRVDLYESLEKYFETTARMYGTYIALDNLGNRDGLISSAFEATLSGKYWKAKCKMFPEFPLRPTTLIKSNSSIRSTSTIS